MGRQGVNHFLLFYFDLTKSPGAEAFASHRAVCTIATAAGGGMIIQTCSWFSGTPPSPNTHVPSGLVPCVSRSSACASCSAP